MFIQPCASVCEYTFEQQCDDDSPTEFEMLQNKRQLLANVEVQIYNSLSKYQALDSSLADWAINTGRKFSSGEMFIKRKIILSG